MQMCVYFFTFIDFSTISKGKCLRHVFCGGMDAFALLYFAKFGVTCALDRRLWIWIWMENFISTARLGLTGSHCPGQLSTPLAQN